MDPAPCVVVEARPYGSDATEGERAAIRARISWLEEGIVLVREMPLMSTFSIDLLFTELKRLTAGLDSYSVLLDLSQTARPTAEMREQLRQHLSASSARTKHIAVFTGSYFLSAMVIFVFGGLGFASISTHKSREKAVEAVRNGRVAGVATALGTKVRSDRAIASG